MELKDVVIVLPSLNPDEKLAGVIDGLLGQGFTDIVLVNDGSDEEHLRYFPDPEKIPEITLLRHEVNRGKGAALKTAFQYIIENRPDCVGVVTADGDGQHRGEDIRACAEKMIAEKDKIILGARDFSQPQVPARSRFGNKTTSLVFRFGCGLKISDTQTGLRAFPTQYLPFLTKVKGDRFEYETNMLLEMRTERIPYAEQRIETVYIEENKTSHFHPIRDSWRIYKLIFGFMLSSLSSALIDLLLFFVLSLFFGEKVMLCTVIARIVSSLYNYIVNYKVVFGSGKNTVTTFVRYYILAVCIMLLSGGGVWLFTLLIPNMPAILKTLFKLLVDTILFLLSFGIQREWVFRK